MGNSREQGVSYGLDEVYPPYIIRITLENFPIGKFSGAGWLSYGLDE